MSLVDESISRLQQGLQEIASWVEENGNDGLFQRVRGDLLRRIGIVPSNNWLLRNLVIGTPIAPRPDESTEEMFRLLEAVIPPDRPIMTRLSTPELGEGIGPFPESSRLYPSIF